MPMSAYSGSFHCSCSYADSLSIEAELQLSACLKKRSPLSVSIVHTGTEHETHVISFRKATKKEQIILFKSLED
jgi:uncharacterized DUF497 family protein